jgi:hypothetical protein
MIGRKLLMAIAILASVAATACSDTTATNQLALEDPSFARSGTLRVTKECPDYHGLANEICTITSANIREIERGSTITYLSDASPAGILDSDVILDLPGPGNNQAFGHCALNLGTGVGVCTLSGGTGKFTWIHARVDVSRLGDPTSTDFAWDGSYRFSPRD